MIGLDFTNLWWHILDGKHKAEVPQIYRTVFNLISAHKKWVVLGYKLSSSYRHECDHENNADNAYTCTYLGLKSALLLESKLNTLAEKVERLETFTATCRSSVWSV